MYLFIDVTIEHLATSAIFKCGPAGSGLRASWSEDRYNILLVGLPDLYRFRFESASLVWCLIHHLDVVPVMGSCHLSHVYGTSIHLLTDAPQSQT